eukprot:4749014-Amphidinium_carterae.1
MLAKTVAPLEKQPGKVICKKSVLPDSSLSRTQRNFLFTLHTDAHRAKAELVCPFCHQDGGVYHALWVCPCRPDWLVDRLPASSMEWPFNFKRFGLILEGEVLSDVDRVCGQDFMTRILIDRRSKQRVMDEDVSRAKSKKRGRALYMANSSDDEDLDDEQHPERTTCFETEPCADEP